MTNRLCPKHAYTTALSLTLPQLSTERKAWGMSNRGRSKSLVCFNIFIHSHNVWLISLCKSLPVKDSTRYEQQTMQERHKAL